MTTLFSRAVGAVLLFVGLLLGGSAEARGPSVIKADVAADAEGALAAPPPPPAGWTTVEGLFVRVHADPGDAATARRVAKHADQALPEIARTLGLPTGRTVDLYVAPDQAWFAGQQPGRVPTWADATAWPSRGLVYLRPDRLRANPTEPLETVLEHELTHIVLGRAFLPRQVPHWLQEGTAQVVAGEYTLDDLDAIGAGLLGDGLLPLGQLVSRFPADPHEASLAYAQSAHFVSWLGATYGKEALPTVIAGLRQGRSVEASLVEATGRSFGQLDAEWQATLSESGLWLKPLVSDTVFFTLAAALIVAAMVRVRRRNRERLSRWEEEDRIQDALVASLRGVPAYRRAQAGLFTVQ